MRRNMTQRALAKATDGVSESALRSYELGERSPKQDALERIAKALDVAPACFDTYGIEHYHELMHALFLLEDRFGIEPCADGNIRLTDEKMRRRHTDVSPGISETIWRMSIRCAGFISKEKEGRDCIDHHQADRCAEFRSHEESARLHQR